MLYRGLTILMTVLILFSADAYAQQRFQLINNDDTIKLSRHFKSYWEPDGELILEQIIERQEQFEWNAIENPNYGFSKRGLWLQATFSNVTDTNKWVIDMAFSQLDKVDFYLVANDRLIAQSRQGKLRSSQQYRLPTIKAELPFATQVDLYVRLESTSSSLIAPIFIQSETTHTRMTFFDNLVWGLFYGGLIVLAIYSSVLYPANKESSMVAYVGYIMSVLLWQFTWGGHIQMIFPNAFTVWLGQHIDLIFIATAISSGIFTSKFLNVRITAPKIAPFLNVFLVILGVLAFCSMFNLIPVLVQNTLVYAFGIAAICSFLFAGFESYLNHFHSARYFIFAWSILAAGALIGMFSLVGIMPSNFFTTYCFQFSVFLEACLFSLALMDKTHSQLEAEVQQATNDLQNNLEFIEEQNARLDIARKDAIQASHIKSQFLANMSHEIRTPLNAILGFSQQLNDMQLPDESREQVRTINAAADNLLSIVNDVLDVSKIEAGKLQINNQPFSPNQLIEEVVGLMSQSAHKKRLEFVLDVDPLPDKLIGDVMRIRQILNNLLSNAVKFTENGFVQLSAKGREQEHGLYELELMVEDTGIGISQQDRQKLFSAFSQVDDALSRSYQGTGLGLVICQQLVKLMLGEMNLSSVPGVGSCFSVSLRFNLLNATSSNENCGDWRDKRVLLFDANPHTRRSTSKMLVSTGCDLSSCDSIEYFASRKDIFDYLFITLPSATSKGRHDIYDVAAQINTDKIIVLYTDPDGFNQAEFVGDRLQAQLRMPLTYTKLESIQHAPKLDKPSRTQQELMQLPAANVLAVDDLEMNLRLLKSWLQDSPLKLTLAHSGEEAVTLCEQQEFDLILMDVQMPEMDGLQASQLIRQTELNIGTPIIAVTAHAFREEQERLLSSGMDDYLPKPIDLSNLIKVIANWCLEQEHQPVALPTLDWELALKRANHNYDAAKEVLIEFANHLPEMLSSIDHAWHKQEHTETQNLVHKLHGASCYTGVPKFQALCDEIEGALKRQQLQHAGERIPLLITEGELVISETQKLINDLANSAVPAADIHAQG